MKQLALALGAIGLWTIVVVAEPATAPSSTQSTQPATTQSTTQFTTKESEAPNHPTRGNLTPRIETDGYFEPIDALEVRIRPEAYQGELKIVSAAAHGASVKQGDILL